MTHTTSHHLPILWLAAALAATGCAPFPSASPAPQEVAAQRPATRAPASVAVSVAISGAVARPMAFDLAALQALPAATLPLGTSVYTGTSLWDLLNKTTGLKTDASAKNPSLRMYVLATGSDGYQAVLSLGEIDPGYGNRPVLVAYAADGHGLGAGGMARLVVGGDLKASRSVSNLARIEVFAAPVAPPAP